MPDTIALADLAMAAYCPRKLYYARTGDRRPPRRHERARELAGRYLDFLVGPAVERRSGRDKNRLRDGDGLATDLDTYVANLEATRERLDAWPAIVEPAAANAFLHGREVHGRVRKVLEEPLAPTLVTPGEPPPEGVWHPQSVRAVGAAKALAWEREVPVERAYVEYARYGIVRRVDMTTRRKAAYRRTLRLVQQLDGPPPRVGSDSKCRTCEYAEECGVRTRSLRSLL